MGYCCSRQLKVNASTVYFSGDAKYPRKTIITIKKRNSREKIIRKETLELVNTEPVLTVSEEFPLVPKLWASACVIPGKDPRGNFNKVCRDFCFVSSEKGKLMGGLFDGHGKEGEKVVTFCVTESDYFFTNELENYSDDYTKFLEDLVQYLELQLEDSSGIDISNSGTSCIIFLIARGEIYVANLGCNRMVLASNTPTIEYHKRRLSLNAKFQFLSEVSNARGKCLNNSLSAFQVSHDHRPNSPSETLRIVSKGGKVKRLVDEYGNFYGPYRVSPNFSNLKGLTVSRSLGDTLMKEIGITSVPTVSNHKIDPTDCFIIVASDGVWRVMGNKDAVDFVESHRSICIKGVDRPTVADVITPENSCISQLLCEEARLRWLAKVENEDTIIDDISCVVIEFFRGEAKEKSNTTLIRAISTDEKENGEEADCRCQNIRMRKVFNENFER
ncbi:hypothetical protein SteCoe_15871 [Stentor coeruleus]|uniref:PPM-type phosphatase domain-containing protein n=1 Tax=Stentor coeruleus TaxID=5963 RepID=A0A1R2C2L8_9CILI|nr:hypothetical protein SteCoe_15871 [Stentor coeruleus]